MLSTNLILAGILAAGLASADVPHSAQHDTTYSLAKSVGTSSIRNLRTMTEPTALDAMTWASPAYQTEKHYTTSKPTYQMKPSKPTYQMKPYADTAGSPSHASWCDNIGSDGGAQADNGDQLLNLDVIVSIGADSVQACCNACVNTNLCIAFSFQPLLVTDVCVLARSRDGTVEGQPGSLIDLNDRVDVDAIVNL